MELWDLSLIHISTKSWTLCPTSRLFSSMVVPPKMCIRDSAGLDREGDVFQHIELAVRVAEGQIAELNAALGVFEVRHTGAVGHINGLSLIHILKMRWLVKTA